MKIDVVIPTYITTNKHLAMSVQCVEQAREYTNIDFNMIIVETKSNYLSDYADVHIYEKNRTTSTKSINNGFSICRGDMVVLLTNDVGLSQGWLERLIECFNNKSDCGAATLASNQFNHIQRDEISEGIWCSVCMFPRKYAKFDENYINSWEDSDVLMRVYSDGLKMYRNFNCVVKHEPGQTIYADKLTQDNWEANKKYFIKKWKDSGILLYNHLVEGTVL